MHALDTSPGTITWLGHGSVLLVTPGGTKIIYDPWLEGNPKAPDGAADIEVDVICVTHGHFDHIGSVVPLALRDGATVICTPELAAYFFSQGVASANLLEMNKGGRVQVADAEVAMVAADHSSGITTSEGEPNLYGGTAVGFVTHTAEGVGRVYVSGDTNVFGDMRLIRELHHPEVALVPIDGHYNMGPREAAHAADLLGVRRIFPIHYGTFPVLTGTPEELVEALSANGSTATPLTINPGESIPLVGEETA